MATVQTFINKTSASKKLDNDKIKAENKLDFSVTNATAADVVQALKIPKGAFVTKVGVLANTAEGATATATVGDGDTANGWDASANLNSTTLNISTEGTDTFGAGKLYTADDTIDLTLGHDLDAAIVTVFAEYTIIASVQDQS